MKKAATLHSFFSVLICLVLLATPVSAAAESFKECVKIKINELIKTKGGALFVTRLQEKDPRSFKAVMLDVWPASRTPKPGREPPLWSRVWDSKYSKALVRAPVRLATRPFSGTYYLTVDRWLVPLGKKTTGFTSALFVTGGLVGLEVYAEAKKEKQIEENGILYDQLRERSFFFAGIEKELKEKNITLKQARLMTEKIQTALEDYFQLIENKSDALSQEERFAKGLEFVKTFGIALPDTVFPAEPMAKKNFEVFLVGINELMLRQQRVIEQKVKGIDSAGNWILEDSNPNDRKLLESVLFASPQDQEKGNRDPLVEELIRLHQAKPEKFELADLKYFVQFALYRRTMDLLHGYILEDGNGFSEDLRKELRPVLEEMDSYDEFEFKLKERLLGPR